MISSIVNLKSIRFRLMASVCLLLVLSLTLVSSTIYFLFAKALRDNERQFLTRLASSYADTFHNSGPETLLNEVLPELAVTIVDQQGTVLFSKSPEYLDKDDEDPMEIAQVEKEIAALPLEEGISNILILSGEEEIDWYEGLEFRLRQLANERKWEGILPIIDNDIVEVLVSPIGNQQWIKIGRSSEEREEELATIRYIALIMFFPFVLVALITSYLLSRTFLAPIQSLTRVISKIRDGDQQLRGKVRGTGDELDFLTSEFNTLLDRNEALMDNLKSSIDNVAHDLRTPMTRFRAEAEAALTSTPSVEKLQEALGEALEGSEKILKMLNAIMDIAEADTHTMAVSKHPLSLAKLLGLVHTLYEFVAEEKSLRITLKVDPTIYVLGDEARLLQAFSNLLDNAIKYSNPQGEVVVSTQVEDGQVWVRFTDQGIGISPEDLGKVWERLYRADKARNAPGLGIGLSIVRAVAKMHNGSTSAQSTPGQGSTFSLSLPICNAPEMPQ